MHSKLIPAVIAAAMLGGSALAAPVETAIYSFKGSSDGGFPHGGVIADQAGNLYGTASSGAAGGGAVFKLTPPANGHGAWKQSTLYSFTGGADGATPFGNLLLDNTGALYGTTYAGGDANGDGVVYKLTPPAAGKKAWTQSVLYTFTGGADGSKPSTTLIEDGSGNLYGTTTSGGSGVVGVVFKLAPPAQGNGAWTESPLYSFTGNKDGGEPFGGVLLASDGSLYGTTAGYGAFNYGTVYQITPPAKLKSAWRFHLVHAFKGGADGEVPRDGLIADSSGALYGTTAGFDHSQGTVFKLSLRKPGGKVWKQDVLYQFQGAGFEGNGPWATVSMDAAGALYGTTLGVGDTSNGEVFKLMPPAPGKKTWSETVLHAFQGTSDSQFPYSTVLIDAAGTLYGTASGTAGQSGFYPGIVWKITQ